MANNIAEYNELLLASLCEQIFGISSWQHYMVVHIPTLAAYARPYLASQPRVYAHYSCT